MDYMHVFVTADQICHHLGYKCMGANANVVFQIKSNQVNFISSRWSRQFRRVVLSYTILCY